MGVEEGVPEGATVGLIVEETKGEDVGVEPGGGVHGMGTGCRVDDWLSLED